MRRNNNCRVAHPKDPDDINVGVYEIFCGHVERIQGQSHAQTLETWLSSSTTQQLIRKPTKNRKIYIEAYNKAQQIESKANYKLRGVENFKAQVADQQQLKPT
ncbi:uncharacterized protein Dvir_GJ25626 [Drosophila virilis]|uniref:Uncharacterized protein n=1 Tax=Drosophila virilis TaxID=7244 RepID=A0A0Q9VZ08_DROVI|nr:uncharacterized protein Dvir_GJ25626 [Drosophila virilis]